MIVIIEIWKDIEGYEGLYQVSNFGNVKSLKRNIVLKPEVLDKGYLRVGLNKNGSRKRFLVHRLVLCTFDSYKSYPEYEVNHKDLNTSNNKLENLEWCTPNQNRVHAELNNPHRHDKSRVNCSLVGKKYGYLGVEASKKPVIQYDKDMNFIARFDSAREASKLGFNYKNISQVCNDKRKTHKGYIWKFEKLGDTND